MKKILFLLLSLVFLSFKHPHYLSVADLKYNEKEKRIEGYVKIFTHDFEGALKNVHKRPVDLLNPADTAATKKIIEQYLTSHFTIHADQKNISYRIIGFENEQEHIYMYIESILFNKPKTMNMQSSLLYETFREQTNIVHIEVNSIKKSLKVTNPTTELKFQF